MAHRMAELAEGGTPTHLSRTRSLEELILTAPLLTLKVADRKLWRRVPLCGYFYFHAFA